MARSNKQARKAKSIFEQDRYTAELSTSQLVLGVCILLTFGLACFLLGILIGRIDPSLQRQAGNVLDESGINERVVSVTRPAEESNAPAPPPELRVPQNMQPTKPVQERPNDTAAETAADEPVKTAENRTPEASVSPVDTPVPIAAAKEPEPSPTEIPEKVAAASESAAKPAPPPEPAAKTNPPKPQPKVPATTTLPAEFDVRYGVQIGYFSSKDGAERAKKELESKTNYTARVVPTTSGKQFKVVVGDYGDWASADTARKDLIGNKGYKGAFPVSLD